jgi:hypothetical protein
VVTQNSIITIAYRCVSSLHINKIMRIIAFLVVVSILTVGSAFPQKVKNEPEGNLAANEANQSSSDVETKRKLQGKTRLRYNANIDGIPKKSARNLRKLDVVMIDKKEIEKMRGTTNTADETADAAVAAAADAQTYAAAALEKEDSASTLWF